MSDKRQPVSLSAELEGHVHGLGAEKTVDSE